MDGQTDARKRCDPNPLTGLLEGNCAIEYIGIGQREVGEAIGGGALRKIAYRSRRAKECIG